MSEVASTPAGPPDLPARPGTREMPAEPGSSAGGGMSTPATLPGTSMESHRRPAEEPGEDNRPGSRRIGVALGSAGLVLVTVGVAVGQGLWVLVGSTISGSVLLRRWLPVDIAIPAAAAMLCLGTVVAGEAAAAAHIDLLAVPTVLAAGYIAAAAAVLVWAARSRRDTVGVAAELRRRWWAWLPAAVPAGLAVLEATGLRNPATWLFSSTDPAEHLVLLQAVQRAGSLDYASQAYPRALHVWGAFAAAPSAALDDRLVLLHQDSQLFAGIVWLSLAVALLTISSFIMRLARPSRVSYVLAAAAAVLVGVVVLLWDVGSILVGIGAAASLFGVACVLLLPLVIAQRHLTTAWPSVVPLGAADTVLLLHLWQPLAAAPVAATAAFVAVTWRDRMREAASQQAVGARRTRRVRRWRPGRRDLLALSALALLLAAAMPAVLYVLRAGGVSLAGTFGLLPPVPWFVVVAVVSATATLPLIARGRVVLVYVASLLGLVVAVAVLLLGAGKGLDFEQWYPAKATWTLVLAALPAVAAVASRAAQSLAVRVWRATGRAGSLSFVLRVSVVAALVLVGGAVAAARVSVWRPLLVSVMSGDGSQPQLDRALRWYDAAQPRLPVVADVGMTDWDAGTSLTWARVYSFLNGQPEVVADLRSVCRAASEIAANGSVVVVTTQDETKMRAAMVSQGCGQLALLHVPGRMKPSTAGGIGNG